MTIFIVGLVLFFSSHLIPTIPALHNALTNALGEKPYKGVASLFALAGFILMVFGFGDAKSQVPMVVWQHPLWTQYIALALMPPAFILLVAAYAPSNIKRFTRHPMLWGATLWALAHLANNGELIAMILFGSFLLYSLFVMISANARGAQKATVPMPIWRDAIVVVIGIVLYALVAHFHANLFGVPAMVHPV